jgi:hypothetical protein
MENLANRMTEWADEYGKERGAFQVNLAGISYIVACREDTAMEIMKQRPFKIIRNENLTAAARGVGADGVFSAEGETWKSDRRILAPVMNKRHVDMYLGGIKTVASRLVDKWDMLSEDGSMAVVINGDIAVPRSTCRLFLPLGRTLFHCDGRSVFTRRMLRRKQGAMFRGMMPIHFWEIPIIGQYLDGLGWGRQRIIDFIESVIVEYEACEDDDNNQQKNTMMGKLLTLIKGEQPAEEHHDGQTPDINKGGIIAFGSSSYGRKSFDCILRWH